MHGCKCHGRRSGPFQSAPCVQGEWHRVLFFQTRIVRFQSAPCVQGECGVLCTRGSVARSFNPRPACRANARSSFPLKVYDDVSIRALRAGRMTMAHSIAPMTAVSIRALRAGRMTMAHSIAPMTAVSIRALRAGRMVARLIEGKYDNWFQSAPCVQGEWLPVQSPDLKQTVSIRALRAGRMPKLILIEEYAYSFQSAPCVQGECERWSGGIRRS